MISFFKTRQLAWWSFYTADGVLVETPSNQNSFNDGITGEALGGASYESAPIISNSYYFSFADDNSQYILTVYGEASQIAELRQSFVSVLPILFLRYSPCIVGNCLGVFSYYYKPGIKNQSDF